MTEIDLSQLPSPKVIETLDFEVILTARKEAFLSLYPEEQQAEMTNRLALESEPLTKLLQESAYRELLLRQRINDAARAVMLAHAQEADLDQIGANYNVYRLTLDVGDLTASPPRAPVYESDNDSVDVFNCPRRDTPPPVANKATCSMGFLPMQMSQI